MSQEAEYGTSAENQPRESRSAVSRRDFLGSVAGVAVAGVTRPEVVARTRPNVLVIFHDQLRAEALGCYGGRNIFTPNMDRLASEGIRFTNAVSPCPLCTPYRGMLQTGRYPTHSGLVVNWVEVNPNQRSIAHVFRDAGYRTGFIGKWHLAAGRRKWTGKHAMTREDNRRIRDAMSKVQERNPEPEYVPPGPSRLGYEHWEAFNFHADFNRAYYYRDTPERLYMAGYETDSETDMAIDFMRASQNDGAPFLLMVAPHPPHPRFQPEYAPLGYLAQIPDQLHWSANVPSDHSLRNDPLPARCYYAMCKNADDNLGRMLQFLDRSGLSRDTILVFTSDHGEMLGSQGRMNKMVPFAESVRIPMIVRWPGRIPAGRTTGALQTPLDHLPTLASLAGLSAPDACDGADLTPVLLHSRTVDRDAVLMMNYTSNWDYFDTGTTWPEWRGVKTQSHTYAKWLNGGELLYDDLEDPGQMRNMADRPESCLVLKRMRELLEHLLRQAHDTFPPGTGYAGWYDDERNLRRTALGPV